jgi:hypothetical protein
MGSLTPGATYIYERNGEEIYAREVGAPHSERFEIGRTAEKQSLIDDLKEQKLWGNIHRASKTNPLLREALERAIIIYHLSEKDGKK